MTEAQFIEQNTLEFEKLASEIDALLAKATEAMWQATRPDNGWTTAQIVEHLWRTTSFYIERVESALSNSPPATPAANVELGFLSKMILKGLAKRRTPAPKQLVVTESISAETALAHWNDFKATMHKHLDSSRSKSVSAAKFTNPFIPLFRMSIADYLALQNEHLRYHGPQIRARVEG